MESAPVRSSKLTGILAGFQGMHCTPPRKASALGSPPPRRASVPSCTGRNRSPSVDMSDAGDRRVSRHEIEVQQPLMQTPVQQRNRPLSNDGAGPPIPTPVQRPLQPGPERAASALLPQRAASPCSRRRSRTPNMQRRGSELTSSRWERRQCLAKALAIELAAKQMIRSRSPQSSRVASGTPLLSSRRVRNRSPTATAEHKRPARGCSTGRTASPAATCRRGAASERHRAALRLRYGEMDLMYPTGPRVIPVPATATELHAAVTPKREIKPSKSSRRGSRASRQTER